jgi:hypothetical protein
MTDAREPLGRAAFAGHVSGLAEQDEPPWQERPPAWDEISEDDREFYMRIGAAVAAAERERIAALMDELAAYYPESVWPPDSDVRDSIGATAMRHAYRNAARAIREPQERTDEEGATP